MKKRLGHGLIAIIASCLLAAHPAEAGSRLYDMSIFLNAG